MAESINIQKHGAFDYLRRYTYDLSIVADHPSKNKVQQWLIKSLRIIFFILFFDLLR